MQQFTKPPKFPLPVDALVPNCEVVAEFTHPMDSENKTRMTYRDWVLNVLSSVGEATSRDIYRIATDRGMQTNGMESTAMRKIRHALHNVASYRMEGGQAIWSLGTTDVAKQVHKTDSPNATFMKCLIAVIEDHINSNDLPESINVEELKSELMSYKIGMQVAAMGKFNETMFRDGLNGQIPVGWTPFAEVAKRVLEQYATVPEVHRAICKIVQ